MNDQELAFQHSFDALTSTDLFKVEGVKIVPEQDLGGFELPTPGEIESVEPEIGVILDQGALPGLMRPAVSLSRASLARGVRLAAQPSSVRRSAGGVSALQNTLEASDSAGESVPGAGVLLDDCASLKMPQFSCNTADSWPTAGQDFAKRIAQCLAPLDQKIELALKEAVQDGCLETDRVTPCDWSPRMFVRELQHVTVRGRENAYKRCERYTGNDFSPGSLIRDAGRVGAETQDMAQSTEHVDRFFDAAKEWSKQQEFPTDPSGHRIFGVKTAGANSLGNDTFGVAYNYDVGWKLQNLDTPSVRICASQLNVDANFGVKATVFGVSQPLVDSHNYLRTDDLGNAKRLSYDTSLQVLGNELLGPSRKGEVTVPMSGPLATLRGLHEHPQESATLLEASAFFTIGPIPVSVSAGAAGSIGIELNLDGEMQYNCPRPTETPDRIAASDVLRLGAVVGVKPHASLSAFAEAAVDIVLASAGVRADLTLLELSIPLSVGVSATIDPGAQAHVHAEPHLSLELEAMNGRVSVFVDTLFGKVVDETIFRWDGLRVPQSFELPTWDMNLRDARLALLP